ncbi:hypothetical protein FVE85_3141 [Porphyridium purpureum]|uniref:CWH43-like N-terminal domain-containing protein n=1 Tax=Porphyridium purpureum TaxID=35688 RepID=A0A5J4YVF4_PORPP|nr:hypothetical protein FVE85_3141 [Porphyridium purpureum]|eukprot:POR8267..scf227_4
MVEMEQVVRDGVDGRQSTQVRVRVRNWIQLGTVSVVLGCGALCALRVLLNPDRLNPVPMISDASVKDPERMAYTLCMSSAALLLMLFNGIIYLRRPVPRSGATFLTAAAVCLGAMAQMSSDYLLHHILSFLVFLFGFLWTVARVIMYRLLATPLPPWCATVHIILAAVQLLAATLVAAFAQAWNRRQGDDAWLHSTGRIYYTCMALSEYSAVLAFAATVQLETYLLPHSTTIGIQVVTESEGTDAVSANTAPWTSKTEMQVFL